MLYLILLVVFLIQFMVALGVLMFIISLARPEAPISGDGLQQVSNSDDRSHPLARPSDGEPHTLAVSPRPSN